MTSEQQMVLSLVKPYVKNNKWIMSYNGVILSTDYYISRLVAVYPPHTYPTIMNNIAVDYKEATRDNWENRPDILWNISKIYMAYKLNNWEKLLYVEDLMEEEKFKEFQFRKVRYGAGKLIITDPMTGRQFLSTHFSGMISCKRADKVSLDIFNPNDGTQSLVWRVFTEDPKTKIISETYFREHNFNQY